MLQTKCSLSSSFKLNSRNTRFVHIPQKKRTEKILQSHEANRPQQMLILRFLRVLFALSLCEFIFGSAFNLFIHSISFESLARRNDGRHSSFNRMDERGRSGYDGPALRHRRLQASILRCKCHVVPPPSQRQEHTPITSSSQLGRGL